MRIKKFNLFITSDDVSDFGKSFSIRKFHIYSFIISSFFILFFTLSGIYFFFFQGDIKTNSSLNAHSIVTESINDSLLFVNDPVKFIKKQDFETSFITSRFTENHTGIDINGTIGTKIYSPIPGKVIYEGYNKKMGNIIIISHNNGYVTKYMHNKKNFVTKGQKISINEPIAEMGNSGSSVKSEGIHVHFELWKDGEVIDPAPFIKNLKLIDSNTLVLKNNLGVDK